MSNQANQTTGTEDASLSIGDLLPIRGRFKERVWRVDSHWPLKAHRWTDSKDSGARRGGYGYVLVDTVTEGVYVNGVRPLSSLKETDEAD